MLNEIKQTKDKIAAFKYDFDPLTKLKISDELKTIRILLVLVLIRNPLLLTFLL